MSAQRALLPLALLASLLTTACARGDGSTPPATSTPIASVAPEKPAAAPSSSDSTSPAGEPAAAPTWGEVVARDQWVAGRTVTARGTISDTPWQHLVGSVAGKQPEYFDLEGSGQTIIYVAATPSCPATVEVEGVVLEVRGPSKRPGEKPTKVNETYRELHIDVARHRCVR